jgi:hypothetical protein
MWLSRAPSERHRRGHPADLFPFFAGQQCIDEKGGGEKTVDDPVNGIELN